MRILKFSSLLLLSLAPSLAGQTFSTPFLGQVIGIQNYPIAVRLAPPNVAGGGYALGSYVCAAYPGTVFYAMDRTQLATGETWYFVQIAKPIGPDTGCSVNVTGWMVGQLKDGRTAIAVQQPGATPPIGTAKAAPARPQPLSVHTVPTGGGEPSNVTTYMLLIIGTLLAVVVLTWERKRRVARRDVLSWLPFCELVMLSLANIVTLRVVAPAYRQVDPNAWGAKMLQQLTGTALGHLLLGFILSILFMKSISFAAPPGEAEVGSNP